MNITSREIMIFAKEDENGKKHYRTGLSSKKQDGSYDTAYIDVRIPKETKIENKTKINITKGFLSFYNYKDKENKQHTIWYVVVQEFTTENQLKNTEVSVVESFKANELDTPDLPF